MTHALCSVCMGGLKMVIGNEGQCLACPNCGGTVDDVPQIRAHAWAPPTDDAKWTDQHPNHDGERL